jgi:acyl carrier protein
VMADILEVTTEELGRETVRDGHPTWDSFNHLRLMTALEEEFAVQFSMDEIIAAVEEAHAFGRYVCAHAYTPQAITRAAKAGVRTIEHGNLIDDASARLMADKGMFLIANLVTYFEMKKHAAEYGMNSDMLAKNDLVIDGALKSLEICKRHGVPVAYGTDLLGGTSSLRERGSSARALTSGCQHWPCSTRTRRRACATSATPSRIGSVQASSPAIRWSDITPSPFRCSATARCFPMGGYARSRIRRISVSVTAT